MIATINWHLCQFSQVLEAKKNKHVQKLFQDRVAKSNQEQDLFYHQHCGIEPGTGVRHDDYPLCER
jgi:hypothetical protein